MRRACLRRLYHLLLHLPRSVAFGRRDHELLDLLELVHAEDSQLVAPVRARLLAEAGGVSRVPRDTAWTRLGHVQDMSCGRGARDVRDTSRPDTSC